MKKLNSKGFTLIELLAVITILGILMLVAIPAVSRTIENSRRDTYGDVAKTYINTVRNAVLADELECGSGEDKLNAGATPDGTYYFKINSKNPNTKDLLEQGGLSSWGNANVAGYVKWVKETKTEDGKEEKTKNSYYIFLIDEGNHGIEQYTEDGKKHDLAEKQITRAKVSTKTSVKYTEVAEDQDVKKIPKAVKADGTDDTTNATECTLK